MERHLRNAPTYAVIIALVIQVTRVSDFGTRIGAGWLAYVYAVFLALTIYALSYWNSRLEYQVTADPSDKRAHSQQVRMARIYKRARIQAGLWLLLFLGIDGALNFAETMSALPANVSAWEWGGAAIYGVFPTLAAYGLGSLQAVLDKVPVAPRKASFLSKLAGKLLARMDASDKQEEHVAGKTDKQEASLRKQGEQVAPASDKQEIALRKPVRKQHLQDGDLLVYLTSNPQASDQQVADYFGVSRQAIQQRRRKLIERGAFLQPAIEPQKVQA